MTDTRILEIITSHPLSQSLGTTSRINAIVDAMEERGINVVLSTPYESGEIRHHRTGCEGQCSAPIQGERTPPSYRVGRYIFSSPVFAARLGLSDAILRRNIDMIFSRALKTARVHRNRIVAMISTDPIASLAALQVKKELGIPAICEFQGVWSEELVAGGLIRVDGKPYRKVREIEHRILKEADYVVAVSHPMKTYLEESFHRDDAATILVFENGGSRSVRYDRIGRPGTRVVYAGMLDSRQNFELFIRSMPHIRKAIPDSEFFLTDKGDGRRRAHRLCKNLRIHPNFFWFQEIPNLRRFLMRCDVAVLTSQDAVARRIATPTKLFEYMALGLPIVANDIGGWCEIISDNKTGVLASDNPEDFANAIVGLLGSRENREDMSNRGQRIMDTEYNWEVLFHEYGQFIDSM